MSTNNVTTTLILVTYHIIKKFNEVQFFSFANCILNLPLTNLTSSTSLKYTLTRKIIHDCIKLFKQVSNM